MYLYLKRPIKIVLFLIISSLSLTLMMSGIKSSSAESISIEDTKIRADKLEKQALEKHLKLQLQEALQIYQMLLATYREIGYLAEQGKILNKIANIYIEQVEINKALEVLQQAINIHKQTGNSKQEAKSLFLKAKVFKNLGRDFLALRNLEKASAISQEIGDSSMEAETLLIMAEIYSYQEKYSLTLKSYEQALALYKKSGNSTVVISILPTMVRLYKNQGNSSRALELTQQALSIAKDTEKINQEIIQAIIAITDIYFSDQEYHKAIAYAQESLTLAYKFNNPTFQLESLNILGKAYNALGDYDKAILYAHQSLAIARKQQSLNNKKIEVHQQAISALSILTSAYASKGEYKKANVYAKLVKNERAALQINGEAGNISILSTSILEIFTKIYDPLGKLHKIVTPKFQKLLEKDYSKRFALAIIANAHNSLGNYKKAIDYSNKSLPLARAKQDFNSEVLALISLGTAYSSLGKYDKAISNLQQATVLISTIEKSDLESSALTLLASTYASIKEYDKALYFAQQGLVIANKEPQALVFPLFVLSGIYVKLGDYEKAIELAQTNLELIQKNEYDNHPKSITPLSASRVNISGNANNTEEKIIDFSNSSPLLIFNDFNHIQKLKFKGLALTILGNAYFSKKEYRKAIKYSQQGLKALQKIKTPITKSTALLNLGISYAELDNEKAAINYLQQSLTLIRKQKNPEVEGAVLAVLGSIYDKFGKRGEALVILQQSLAVTANTETANNEFYPYLVLARIYRDLNKPSVAIAYYKEAIKRIENIRGNIGGLSTDLQESFLQAIQDIDGVTTADVYRELADLLLYQERILEAQQVLELLKIKEINNFTKNTNSRGEASPIHLNRVEQKIIEKHGSLIAFGQKVYECKQTNCKQQSQLNDQLEYLRTQYNQTVDTFVAVVRERKGKDDAFFDPRNLNDAQNIVEAQPDTVLIYPFVLEDKIWLLWVSKGGIVKSIKISQMGQHKLGQSVLKFRQLINNPDSDISEVKIVGKELYDLLIKPLESELNKNNIKNLVFALDRITRYIPMSALHDGKKYLVENYNISTILSAELTDTKTRLPIGVENNSVLGLGLSNAVSGWSALPNVKDEVDSIVLTNSQDQKGIFPGLEFLNQTFTRKVLRDKASKHQIVHIATHGKFVPGSYLDSFLLLGDGKKLTIDDIRNLPDLGEAHLVVLSACETALANAMQDGVEIASIAYHFLNGGAETVMASLWLVNDRSTRILMENFYQNLALGTAKNPVTKAQALRQAQLSLLHGNNTTVAIKPRGGIVTKPVIGKPNNPQQNNFRRFSHPYYWTPFILIGNGL